MAGTGRSAEDEAAHLAELAEQCREKASNMPPSFSKIQRLRRAEFLKREAQERLRRELEGENPSI
jgi:hypothetical protein